MAEYIITLENIFLNILIGILFRVLAPIKLPPRPPEIINKEVLIGIFPFTKYIIVLIIDRGSITEIAVACAL